MRAGRGKHPFQAGPRIGRAADDLYRAVAGIDHADLQPVGIRMPLRRNHFADPERRERGRRILDRLDLEPEHRQTLGDFGQRRIGLQVILQPGQGELHGASPRSRDGVSSERNP